MEKKLSYQLIDKGFFGISIRSSIWKRKKGSIRGAGNYLKLVLLGFVANCLITAC